MIKLKANSTTYILPTKGEELSMGNFLALQEWAKAGNHGSAELVSALSGLPVDDALQVAGKWERYFDFESIVSSLESYPSLDAPKLFEVSGQKVKRRNFGQLKAGQRILLQELKDIDKSLARIVAICIAPDVYKDNWASNVSLLEEEVKQMDASVAVPLAYFFLGSGMITRSSGVMYLFRLILTLSRQKIEGWKSISFGAL